MGRLKILSGKELCAILSNNGFRPIRQHGSHIIMQLALENSTVTVPVPNHKTIRTGTLISIIRQSGLNRKFFEAQ